MHREVQNMPSEFDETFLQKTPSSHRDNYLPIQGSFLEGLSSVLLYIDQFLHAPVSVLFAPVPVLFFPVPVLFVPGAHVQKEMSNPVVHTRLPKKTRKQN